MSFKNLSRNRIIAAAIAVILCITAFTASCTTQDFGGLVDSDIDTSQDFVRVMDIGQGDCILVYSNGYSALIDTGIEESANSLCAELKAINIEKIDVLLLSHLHDDHTGGVGRIAEFFDIANVILPEISIESEGLGAAQLAINKVTSSNGGVYTATQGMNFEIGDFELTILASYGDMADENNRSIFVVAEIDGVKFLFTGDAEAKAEKQLLKEGLNLKCDVLKVGHHGSSTSSCEEFLKAVRPRYAAISAGADNMYGHPHSEVLADLEYVGAEIYRTDRDGSITFYVEDGKISPETEN